MNNNKLTERIAISKADVETTKALISQLEEIIENVRKQERSIVDYRCKLGVQLNELKVKLTNTEGWIKDMEEELNEQ